MSLPKYSALSGTQFRVGFGPRGTQQKLILTQVHVNRIAGCEGRVVVDPDLSVEREGVITETSEGRSNRVFTIPWELRSEEDVQHAMGEALHHAHGLFANRVAFTPTGMDAISGLLPDQSARAMLGAIYSLWAGEENQVPNQILISIHANSMAYQDFELALEKHFFPYRSAENPNSGLNWKRAARRWGARNFKGSGQILFECLESLSTNSGRDTAQSIHQIAQERPDIFKAKDVDRMSGFDSYEGIPETLLILRNLGGRLGEAARRALVNREKAVAMDVVRNEVRLITEADNEELFLAASDGRENFLVTLALGLTSINVDDMDSGYENLWGKMAKLSFEDDRGVVRPQFVQFHRADPVAHSKQNNELFTMGMRVANREEAAKILKLIKVAVLERYGRKANMGSHRLDGTQEWFLNICAEYRDQPPGRDPDWFVGSLPEDIGRGTLYLHFQNHAESDWDSHRVLRILVEDFGLTFVSPRDV